jgi:hypothetical protein
MPAIHFSHPAIKDSLTVQVGIEQCSWGYGMNAVTYPTYGGEVVQILSVYVDDLTLGGTVATYEQMEGIYGWFLDYMEKATQGSEGTGSYNTDPIQIFYPFRGWTWEAYPESLPGFAYGREIVAPTWQLTCKVHEADDAVTGITLQAAQDGLARIPLGIGYEEANPFSDPMADKQFKNKEDLDKFWEDATDKFAKLIPSYMDGDYESLLGDIGSKPAFLKASLDESEDGDQTSDRNR